MPEVRVEAVDEHLVCQELDANNTGKPQAAESARPAEAVRVAAAAPEPSTSSGPTLVVGLGWGLKLHADEAAKHFKAAFNTFNQVKQAVRICVEYHPPTIKERNQEKHGMTYSHKKLRLCGCKLKRFNFLLRSQVVQPHSMALLQAEPSRDQALHAEVSSANPPVAENKKEKKEKKERKEKKEGEKTKKVKKEKRKVEGESVQVCSLRAVLSHEHELKLGASKISKDAVLGFQWYS